MSGSLPRTLVLGPDPGCVGAARAFTRSHCVAAQVCEQACDDAVLLTSEVVTNALTHGRSEARLVVTVGRDAVTVEVGDDNSRHPQMVVQDLQALDGRGMSILDALAARWGVREDALGKVVWFQIST